MDAAAQTFTWHSNEDGVLTQYPMPFYEGKLNSRDVMDLTDDQHLHLIAHHEAAHTILYLTADVPVQYTRILTRTEAAGESPGHTRIGDWTADFDEVVMAIAAGERAEDRWMRNHNLWNPTRAWATERHAGPDRENAAIVVRECHSIEMTYGITPTEWSDYARIQQGADEAITQHWGRIIHLAGHLVDRRHITADELTTITGLPNSAA